MYPTDDNGVRHFPTFTVEQTENSISLTDCENDSITTLNINLDTGQLMDSLHQPTIPCDHFSLTDGTTITIQPDPAGSFAYQFTNYVGNDSINWQRLYRSIPFFINADNILTSPLGGFHLYNRSPFIIQKYASSGQLLYSTRPLDLPNAYGSRIVGITETGDLLIRSGHLGGNETHFFMAKISGVDGRLIWQTEIETYRNLAQDTRIAIENDYPLVVVENFYGIANVDNQTKGGWSITLLDPETGQIIHQQEKTIIGNAALSPVIVPDRGIYCLQEQYITDQVLDNERTGYQLLRFSNEAEIIDRTSLFAGQTFSSLSLSQTLAVQNDAILFIGTKSDSLWMVKYNLRE
ncbi:MAG: hypothetical protein AB8G22_22005 [Saprospiraceae bacterium]